MTKTEWEALSGKQRWDVLVALRGPDTQPSDTMKWFTTSVIRHAMGKVIRVGGMINDLLHMVVLPKSLLHLPASPHDSLVWDGRHFCQHVEEAAGILGIPIVRVPNDVWIKAMKQGVQDAAKQLLPHVPPPLKEEFTTHYTDYLGGTDVKSE